MGPANFISIGSPASRFVLGTAQLGMTYGVHNKTGQPTEEQALALLKLAYAKGVRELDTSDVYGTSDKIISKAIQEGLDFKVHTKFVLPDSTINISEVLRNSLSRLGLNSLKSYSFHRFQDFEHALQLKLDMKMLKDLGLVEKIGVSVYTEAEGLAAIECSWVDQIQMSLNLLDHHGRKGRVLKAIQESRKELHVRSLFLQGLFHMSHSELGSKFSPLAQPLLSLREIAKSLGVELPQLALMYGLSLPEVSKVVIGVETMEQLNSNLNWVERFEPLTASDLSKIQLISVDRPDLLSPANW